VREVLGLTDAHLAIGLVGILEPRKNVGMFLNMAQRIHFEAPHTRFVIAGEGSEESRLRRMAADLGIADVVMFVGFREDVPQLLQGLDIFVMTSFAEGLPRAVMEAMAAGLPCVVTDVGGNAEAVRHGETGYVVAVDDPVGIVAAVRELVGQKDRRLEMGAAARARAFAVFNPERMAAKYLNLYRELLAERQVSV
jgi:glycosyltransferase involved in cell wall biosynthesis